jgi:hypothetical protein
MHDSDSGATQAKDSTEPRARQPGVNPIQPGVVAESFAKTRLQSGIRKEKICTDGTVRYDCFTSTGEPQNLAEAIGDKNWKHALDIEYSALMNNETWRLVPYQKSKNIIDCKLVYMIKRKA